MSLSKTEIFTKKVKKTVIQVDVKEALNHHKESVNVIKLKMKKK